MISRWRSRSLTKAESGWHEVRKLTKRLAIVSLIALSISAAMTLPSGASTGIHLRVMATTAGPLTVPKSQIIGSGSSAVFNPTALTVAEDTSGNNCSPLVKDMSIVNKGTKTAYVTYGGAPLGSIPAGHSAPVCWSGGQAGDTVTLGLSNKMDTKAYSSTLTITFSS